MALTGLGRCSWFINYIYMTQMRKMIQTKQWESIIESLVQHNEKQNRE